VFVVCFVGRGLWDDLITRWRGDLPVVCVCVRACVCVCALEILTMSGPRPDLDSCATKNMSIVLPSCLIWRQVRMLYTGLWHTVVFMGEISLIWNKNTTCFLCSCRTTHVSHTAVPPLLKHPSVVYHLQGFRSKTYVSQFLQFYSICTSWR
jgi:hypothetical protein